METYGAIMEKRLDKMEFDAGLQGVDIKRPRPESNKSEDKSKSFNDRIRARVEGERIKAGSQPNGTKFSEGVGYRVIGG